MIEKTKTSVWGWVMIEGYPKYIEFTKYGDDTLMWSKDPNDDYLIEEHHLSKSKNDLLDNQIQHCTEKARYWNDMQDEYEAMKDLE